MNFSIDHLKYLIEPITVKSESTLFCTIKLFFFLWNKYPLRYMYVAYFRRHCPKIFRLINQKYIILRHKKFLLAKIPL